MAPAPPVHWERGLMEGGWLARRRADGRVPARRATQHARALGRGEGASPHSGLPPAGEARRRPGTSPGGGGPPDRTAAKRRGRVSQKRRGRGVQMAPALTERGARRGARRLTLGLPWRGVPREG